MRFFVVSIWVVRFVVFLLDWFSLNTPNQNNIQIEIQNSYLKVKWQGSNTNLFLQFERKIRTLSFII